MRRWIHDIVAGCCPAARCFASRAATPDETRMYRVAEAAFKDGLNDLAERQFASTWLNFPIRIAPMASCWTWPRRS